MLGLGISKRWRLLGFVAIVTTTFGLGAIACSSDEGDGDPTATVVEPTAEEADVAPPGPATFNVRAGDAGGTVTVNAFLPGDVAVREGDTIHWTFPSPEIHTVTFLAGGEAPGIIVPIESGPALQINPAVAFPAGDPAAYDGAALLSSGILPSEEPPADSFDATFTTAGTYSYVCLIHTHMTGNVVVVAADEEVAAPSVVTADGEGLLQTYLQEGEDAAATLEATSVDNADGTKTWTMPMGITTEHTDVLAFIPGDLEIGAGDTVKWLNDSEAPHTVTFTSGAEVPPFLQPTPQAAGPPILSINPQVAGGVPATEPPVDFDRSGDYINSGILGPAPEFPAQEWSATFATAGTYSYVCVIHLPNGMTGQVTVTE